MLWVAVALFLSLFSNTYADLPIHCLNIQVSGRWVFEMSAATGDRMTRCGHKVPDTNLDHFTKKGYDLEVVKKYTLDLKEPNIAVDASGNVGTWTMVYDEGFEVIINNKRFFAFNKYVPKTPESLTKDDVEDYTSICDETLVGWFHNEDGSNWGCYHGKKLGNLSDQRLGGNMVHARKEANLKVLAPEFSHVSNSVRETQTFDIPPSPETNAEFLQLQHDVLWEPDYSFIELHNSDTSKTWKADVHQQFLGKRMTEMMTMLGYRSSKAVKPNKKRTVAAVHDSRPDHIKYADLPEHFDWRNYRGNNYDSPVKNQANCGSCFAMATISVVEARVRIMSNNHDRTALSSQEVVSCSVYNQGCEGGYPYLVAKHAMDYGLVPEDCMDYSGTDSECRLTRGPDCPDPKRPRRYFASNYSYIGGYYGACSELAMMREIIRGGPIMVAFDAPSSLFYYSGGIYTGEAPPHEGIKLPGLNLWEKTNHAVVAVGWGVENGKKYWIIKNTWGAEWGEHGYFRIRRGTDECGVESMASTLDIVLPTN